MSPPRQLLCLGLGLLLLAAAARPAAASQLVALDTTQLVARAERIVVGTVIDQQSRWTGDRATIVTDVRIRVSGAMLGAREGEIITVRRLGGAVKDIGMKVFGEASFSDGEEVLLFAERRGEAYYSVGMTQGTLHLRQEGGRKVAESSLAGAELIGARASRPAIRPLDEVLREVRSALAVRSAQELQTKPRLQPEGKR